jgi:hypothetical protein
VDDSCGVSLYALLVQAREIAHQSNKLLEQCDRKVRSGAGPRRRLRARSDTIGALVLGGDYQGFGIVRSLGRRGIPVCVIDDEPSVARHSQDASHTVWVPRLFAEEETSSTRWTGASG